MEFKLDAYCGLYCGACPVMLAQQNGNLEALAKSNGLEPEAVRCLGCKSEKVSVFCTSCKIRPCASGKGFDFCFQCDKLPCAPFIAFRDSEEWPYHAAVPKNLERVQQVGVDVWLEEQDTRWRCPKCGTKFAWQDETCKSCGEKVSNYKADL
jgi:predicted RNA-binding Zn-ribbon protein involved in translation (DUF1610 family)